MPGGRTSTYYYKAKPNNDLELLEAIETILLRQPTLGYRTVTKYLQREGLRVNAKRVYRVMKEHDLVIRHTRKLKSTTQSDHEYGRYPNLLKGLKIERPDQVWCADITYIQMQEGTVYLAIIIDVYTRSLRGWNLGQSLSTALALDALKQALRTRCPAFIIQIKGCSDYIGKLEEYGIEPSMSAKGTPTDNPYAERVIRTTKEEEVYLQECRDVTEARRSIQHFIEVVYQTKRIHSSLGYLTPIEFEAVYDTMQAS